MEIQQATVTTALADEPAIEEALTAGPWPPDAYLDRVPADLIERARSRARERRDMARFHRLSDYLTRRASAEAA